MIETGSFYRGDNDFELLDPQILEYWKNDGIESGALGIAIFYDGSEHYCMGFDDTIERDEMLRFYGIEDYLAGIIYFR